MLLPRLLVLVAAFLAAVAPVEAAQDRAISKVVKLLQGMLEKSKADGETDTTLFAKYKCYCDTNAADKEKAIADSKVAIQLLSGEISELQGSNGELSAERADLEARMGENERGRSTADSLRSKAQAAFAAEEQDMRQAAEQMDEAIATLSAVGADQTAPAADTTALLAAGTAVAPSLSAASFLGASSQQAPVRDAPALGAAVRKALDAASIFLAPRQQRSVASFLQASARKGDYSAQSGEIVGILKNMRDTFLANLASAQASEAKSLEAYTKLTKVKTDEFDKMRSAHEEAEAQLGSNDGTLNTKKTQKADAEASLTNDEEFLTKLQKLCAAKTAEYETRKMVRANENSAIAQAITILNSDSAFETSGSVGATSFLQTQGVAHRASVRDQVSAQLVSAAKRSKSLKLVRIAASLEKGNPFEKVVEEIEKMIAMIAKEEAADDEQKLWCDEEREENHGQKEEKESSITTLNGQITGLNEDLDSAADGLRKQLADEEASLAENRKDQIDTAAERSAENAAYQKNVGNLIDAEKMVKRATAVLTKFYDWMHAKMAAHHYDKKAGKDSSGGNLKRIPEATTDDLEAACSADPACTGFNSDGWLKSAVVADADLVDSPGDLYVKVFDDEKKVGLLQEDPAPPETFADGGSAMEGQSGKANDVITQLQFILSETIAEEEEAHEAEKTAQHDFEDEMNTLKSQEASSMELIASLEEQVAEKEKAVLAVQEDLSKVEAAKATIEGYLLKIRSGCDFITKNIDARKEGRSTETDSLNTAIKKLKSTPAFKEAAAEAEKEALGACGESCVPDRESLPCRACVAGTSESAYCASHTDQAGC